MVSGEKEVSQKVDLKIQKHIQARQTHSRQSQTNITKAGYIWRKAKEIASDQTMMQAIAQAAVEAAKVTILARREA